MQNYLKLFVCFIAVPLILFGCARMDPSKTEGEVYDDQIIKSKAIEAVKCLKLPYEISVNVDRGIVQLSGFVDFEKQALEIERKVSCINGVKDVINHIIVRSSLAYIQERADSAALSTVKPKRRR